MPIDKQEFENGKLHSRLEDEIISFLNERKERAFTSQEIMEGIRYHTEFSTPEISKMSTFAIADFTAFLHHLVEKGKIKTKIVRGRMYIMTAEDLIKCPKCGEVAKPKKTWKMAGRPNKKGEKLQLTIGLFGCPKHGAFRKVLNKQKIVVQTGAAPSQTRKKKKMSTKKRAAKKKITKKKERKKKSKAWLLA